MSCGIDRTPFVAFVVCVRSPPTPTVSEMRPLTELPLFRMLLPSLAVTVKHAEYGRLAQSEHKDGALCLYVCGHEDDETLMSRAKELRDAILRQARGFGVRMLFYPAGSGNAAAIRGAAQAAYADGAAFIHHTYDDVMYADAGWITHAVEQARRYGAALPRVRPLLPPTSPATATPSLGLRHQPALVARRHLDLFDDLYPLQLPDDARARDYWIAATYRLDRAALADHATAPTGASARSNGDGRPRGSGGAAKRAAASIATDTGAPAAALVAALVDCGRRVLATNKGASVWNSTEASLAHTRSPNHHRHQWRTVPGTRRSACTVRGRPAAARSLSSTRARKK